MLPNRFLDWNRSDKINLCPELGSKMACTILILYNSFQFYYVTLQRSLKVYIIIENSFTTQQWGQAKFLLPRKKRRKRTWGERMERKKRGNNFSIETTHMIIREPISFEHLWENCECWTDLQVFRFPLEERKETPAQEFLWQNWFSFEERSFLDPIRRAPTTN